MICIWTPAFKWNLNQISDHLGCCNPPLSPVAVTLFRSELTVAEGNSGWAEPAQGVIVLDISSYIYDTYIYHCAWYIYLYTYIYISSWAVCLLCALPEQHREHQSPHLNLEVVWIPCAFKASSQQLGRNLLLPWKRWIVCIDSVYCSLSSFFSTSICFCWVRQSNYVCVVSVVFIFVLESV